MLVDPRRAGRSVVGRAGGGGGATVHSGAPRPLPRGSKTRACRSAGGTRGCAATWRARAGVCSNTERRARARFSQTRRRFSRPRRKRAPRDAGRTAPGRLPETHRALSARGSARRGTRHARRSVVVFLGCRVRRAVVRRLGCSEVGFAAARRRSKRGARRRRRRRRRRRGSPRRLAALAPPEHARGRFSATAASLGAGCGRRARDGERGVRPRAGSKSPAQPAASASQASGRRARRVAPPPQPPRLCLPGAPSRPRGWSAVNATRDRRLDEAAVARLWCFDADKAPPPPRRGSAALAVLGTGESPARRPAGRPAAAIRHHRASRRGSPSTPSPPSRARPARARRRSAPPQRRAHRVRQQRQAVREAPASSRAAAAASTTPAPIPRLRSRRSGSSCPRATTSSRLRAREGPARIAPRSGDAALAVARASSSASDELWSDSDAGVARSIAAAPAAAAPPPRVPASGIARRRVRRRRRRRRRGACRAPGPPRSPPRSRPARRRAPDAPSPPAAGRRVPTRRPAPRHLLAAVLAAAGSLVRVAHQARRRRRR